MGSIGLRLAMEVLLTQSCVAWLWLLFSHSVRSDSLQPQGLQNARLPCPLPSSGACSNSWPLSHWCHPTTFSSVILSPPAFNLSNIGVFSNELALHIKWPKYWTSASASVPEMNIQNPFPLRLTGLISLQFKGL